MRLQIYLTPNSAENSIFADGDDMFGNVVYKCKIKAVPKQWKANKELIKYLSDLLSIPKSSISIVRWAKSRHKVVEIDRDNLTLPF